jgi:glycosyltransferase involved in cell wall biosynthesis
MERLEPEIGYILKGYPRTSETFITNEIFLLESAGLKLTIFSLKTLTGQKRHGVVESIKAPVIYLPETTPSEESGVIAWLWQNIPGFAASHWRLFRRRPAAYLRTLVEMLAMCLSYRAHRFAAPNRAFIKEFLQAGFIALKILESGRIRHLHAHFCHTSTTVAMLASRLSGAPFSFTAHAKDIYREDMNPGDLLTVKMRRASFAVTCTRANQEYLDRLRPAATPLYAIYHGLNLSLFNPIGEGADTEIAPPLILSVGRLVEKKGFTLLVEACRLLKDKGYQFNCWIVGGEDQHAEAIRSLIKQLNLVETVVLPGAVTQEELRQIYARATVFALPCQVTASGDRDGIPNVLVEAMAMELPVVSTDISGIPELIDHRANGLLIPQKDAVALAAAIEELLNDAALRQTLGKAARAKVRRSFDAHKNIQKLKTLFDHCLQSNEMGASIFTREPGANDVIAYSRDHR